MKIMTIFDRSVITFDRQVNEAMANGYKLTRREVLPGRNSPNDTALYAELVRLDEPEAPPLDPLDALRAIKATCEGVTPEDCRADRCPLSAWCQERPDGYDPVDWDIPEKEAGR